MEEPTGEDKLDQRLDFLGECALRAFRVKKDVWQRCLSVEDNRRHLQDFLDRPGKTFLLLTVGLDGLLHIADSCSSRSRTVKLTKKTPAVLSPQTIKEDVRMWSCSSAAPQLLCAVDQVRC